MATIPKNLGNLKSLKAREVKAFSKAAEWEDVLDDAYNYYLPQRNLFNREDRGQKKMSHIFDGIGQEVIKQAASKIQENIAPIWSRWANFEPSNEVLRAIEAQGDISESDVRDNLQEQAEILFDVLNRSNFGTQFFEFALDLLIGTGTLVIDEDESDEMPIVFNSTPQIGIAFEESPHGNIETHWKRFKVKARNIERMWKGFEVSQELAHTIKDAPESDVDLVQGVVFDHVEQKYYAVVWVKAEDKVSWVEDFGESSPFITARYAKVSGEIRGRGPALDALPDVKTLNKAKEFALTKAAIDLSGMWTSVDDGVTNPYNMVISPGIVIPVGSNNSQNPSIQRLDTSNNLDLALFIMEDLKNSIRRTLFADLREPSDAVVSATQFAIESRDIAKRIGSAFGRIQTEALIPILKRVHFILKRRGLVQPITIGGREVNIKFTSPLARAQDSEDLLSVQQAVEFTLSTAGIEAVQASFAIEDFGEFAAKKTGMPMELIRSKQDKQLAIQAGAEAEQQGIQNEPRRNEQTQQP